MDWSATIDKIGPPLLRYFCGSFPRQIADELVQETIIRLVRKVETGKYDPSKGSFLKYAYGIARFVKLEGMKALPAETLPGSDFFSDQLPMESGSPDFGYDQQLRARKIRAALLRLPEVQREILLLILDKDLSLSEIAEILEMPLGTIKSHVHRAKRSLQEIVQVEEAIK